MKKKIKRHRFFKNTTGDIYHFAPGKRGQAYYFFGDFYMAGVFGNNWILEDIHTPLEKITKKEALRLLGDVFKA